MEVVIDKREKSSIIPEILKDMGVKITFKQVSVGDYLLPNDVAIERKTVNDLSKSLLNKRVFKQVSNLKKYKNPLLVVEGEQRESTTNINGNSLRGLVLSIMIDFNTPVFFTKNESETAVLIYTILKKQNKTKKEIDTRVDVKPKTDNQIKIHAITALPCVGPQLAKRILKKHKTLNKVFSLTKEELVKIDGIGKNKADRIFRIIDEEFKNETK